jgi:hypothetical protein
MKWADVSAYRKAGPSHKGLSTLMVVFLKGLNQGSEYYQAQTQAQGGQHSIQNPEKNSVVWQPPGNIPGQQTA